MKTSMLAFFFFAFVFALSTALGLSVAAIDVEPVLDGEGNPVFDGGLYLMIQTSGGSGGGVELAALHGETCPISVVQGHTALGIPLYIRIVSTQNANYVYPTTSLDISFQSVYPCANSSKWIVKNFASFPAVFIGEEDESTVAGHFRIQKSGNDYKFVFCPDIIPGTCWDLGFSPSEDERLVKNPGNPFTFVIWRLNIRNSASIM